MLKGIQAAVRQRSCTLMTPDAENPTHALTHRVEPRGSRLDHRPLRPRSRAPRPMLCPLSTSLPVSRRDMLPPAVIPATGTGLYPPRSPTALQPRQLVRFPLPAHRVA